MTDFGMVSKIVDAMKGLHHGRKEKKLWEEYVAKARSLKEVGANCWFVTLGSEAHRRSEVFVQRGWAERSVHSQSYRPVA